MPDFVGISSSDTVARRQTFRIVIERYDWALLLDHLNFAASVTDFYNTLLAKTGVVYAVSPNPAVYASGGVLSGEQATYALDVRVSDNPVGVAAGADSTGITAADVVNRLDAVSPRVRVVRFEAIGADAVMDASGRDAAVTQQIQQDASNNPLAGLGHWATLAVFALCALAAIQISKDL